MRELEKSGLSKSEGVQARDVKPYYFSSIADQMWGDADADVGAGAGAGAQHLIKKRLRGIDEQSNTKVE